MPKMDPKKFLHTDVFTGEEFKSHVEQHYELVDSVPFAPRVEMRRPTVRERVENLLNRGVDPLAHYVGAEGIDMDIPDDADSPLTASEQNYIDILAADLAERAPLPDEGLPRPDVQNASAASAAAPEGVSSPPKAPDPQAPAPAGAKPVPT